MINIILFLQPNKLTPTFYYTNFNTIFYHLINHILRPTKPYSTHIKYRILCVFSHTNKPFLEEVDEGASSGAFPMF